MVLERKGGCAHLPSAARPPGPRRARWCSGSRPTVWHCLPPQRPPRRAEPPAAPRAAERRRPQALRSVSGGSHGSDWSCPGPEKNSKTFNRAGRRLRPADADRKNLQTRMQTQTLAHTHIQSSDSRTMGIDTPAGISAITHGDVHVRFLARHRKRSTGVTATLPDSYQLHTDDPRSIFWCSQIIAQLKIWGDNVWTIQEGQDVLQRESTRTHTHKHTLKILTPCVCVCVCQRENIPAFHFFGSGSSLLWETGRSDTNKRR